MNDEIIHNRESDVFVPPHFFLDLFSRVRQHSVHTSTYNRYNILIIYYRNLAHMMIVVPPFVTLPSGLDGQEREWTEWTGMDI